MEEHFTHGDNIQGKHVDGWIILITDGYDEQTAWPRFSRAATQEEIELFCDEYEKDESIEEV